MRGPLDRKTHGHALPELSYWDDEPDDEDLLERPEDEDDAVVPLEAEDALDDKSWLDPVHIDSALLPDEELLIGRGCSDDDVPGWLDSVLWPDSIELRVDVEPELLLLLEGGGNGMGIGTGIIGGITYG